MNENDIRNTVGELFAIVGKQVSKVPKLRKDAGEEEQADHDQRVADRAEDRAAIDGLCNLTAQLLVDIHTIAESHRKARR